MKKKTVYTYQEFLDTYFPMTDQQKIQKAIDDGKSPEEIGKMMAELAIMGFDEELKKIVGDMRK